MSGAILFRILTGASPDERKREMPADSLVPHPLASLASAITIEAAPSPRLAVARAAGFGSRGVVQLRLDRQ